MRVAVDLVNLLTPGLSDARPVPPPVAGGRVELVARALGLQVEEVSLGEREDEAFVELAGQLRQVIAAVDVGETDWAAGMVNQLLRDSGAAPQLDRHGDGPWHLHFHGRDADLVSSWAAGCATSMAVALGGEFRNRLGVCHAAACDRVYFDESRNGSRRYCSLACQNRTKAGTHRARARLD